MSQSKETFMSDREREANGLPLIYAGMSKTDIAIAAKTAVDNLLDSGNTLAIAEQVAAMEAFLKEVKGDPRYTDYVRSEVEKYGKEYKAASGAKIELAETGTRYDFSKCCDGELNRMTAESVDLALKIEARKDFLKTVPLSGLLITDEDTGETYKVYPPSKTSTSSFKITLAR